MKAKLLIWGHPNNGSCNCRRYEACDLREVEVDTPNPGRLAKDKTMDTYYKAVRLDRTSHYDGKTKWRKGAVVREKYPEPADVGPCGRGIHCSPTLLDVIRWQAGPSRYYLVEPLDVITGDDTKIRCSAVRVLGELGKAEQDELAGFRLYEANHPIQPFHRKPRNVSDQWIEERVYQWHAVRSTVGYAIWNTIWDAVWHAVWNVVEDAVWNAVWGAVWNVVRSAIWDTIRNAVGDAALDAVYAYIGGLFPNITEWKHVEHFGPTPWKPLCDLWYAGYVPSFDGKIWRVHCGPKAEIKMELDFCAKR